MSFTNTSDKVGRCIDRLSTRPTGSASITRGISSWPRSCSSSTLPSTTRASSPRRAASVGAELFGVARLQGEHVARDALLQPRGRVLGDHAPFVDHRDAVAALGLFGAVRGEQHGQAALRAQRLDALPDLAEEALVEPGGRLVHQEQRRLVQERARELEPAAHAARVLRARGDPRAPRAR